MSGERVDLPDARLRRQWLAQPLSGAVSDATSGRPPASVLRDGLVGRVCFRGCEPAISGPLLASPETLLAAPGRPTPKALQNGAGRDVRSRAGRDLTRHRLGPQRLAQRFYGLSAMALPCRPRFKSLLKGGCVRWAGETCPTRDFAVSGPLRRSQ